MKNKKIFNGLVGERSSGFRDLQKKIDPDHMVSMYKTEGKSPKDFRNYQNLIELFKDLKDGNINPKELLKDQINLKSELGEIKRENQKSKSEDQISVIENIRNIFDLREKIIDFGRDYSLFLSEVQNINS